MSQTERIFYIMEQLSSKGYVCKDEIAKRFEISKRQVTDDFTYFKDRCLAFEGVHFVYDSQKRAHVYNGKPLPQFYSDDMVLLSALVKKKLAEKGELPFLDNQIISFFNSIITPEGQRISEKVTYDLPGAEPVDRTILSKILHSLGNRKQVAIEYIKGDSDTPTTREIEPYHLRNYKGYWYLFAWCTLRKDLRVFHLSRITVLHETGKEFESNIDDHDITHAIESEFGIYREKGEETTAIIQFDPKAALSVKRKQYHPAQTMEESADGTLRLNLPASAPEEIVTLALSFGEYAQVLAPPHYRALWIERIQAMCQKHLQAK